MEIGLHRGTIANENIWRDINTYDKVKNFKYLGSVATNQILCGHYEVKLTWNKYNCSSHS